VDELAPVLIDTVEKGHPEAPIILQTLARGYILRLRYKPGYACISRWIELYPDAVKAYQWRGWVLERLNNHKGATKDYHRALELAPDLFPVRLRVAEMLLEDKQAPEALPHLERLYRQAPNDPHVQARLGMCRFLQGRAEEARQLMEAAVVHLPRDPALIVHLAKLDLQEGRAAEAERWLRVILKTEASDTEALYVMVSALQVQGRSEESARGPEGLRTGPRRWWKGLTSCSPRWRTATRPGPTIMPRWARSSFRSGGSGWVSTGCNKPWNASRTTSRRTRRWPTTTKRRVTRRWQQLTDADSTNRTGRQTRTKGTRRNSFCPRLIVLVGWRGL